MDHIKKLTDDRKGDDFFLKMVISDFFTTKWKDVYGLNIKETMELEFSEYLLLIDELNKNKEIVANQHLNDLNN